VQDPQRFVAIVEALFAGPVRAAVASPAMYAAPLLGAEAEGAARWTPKRRAEFAAGRAAARVALAALGSPPQELPRRADRAPAWPAGIVGSISHCDGCCAAVVGRRAEIAALGFDVEVAQGLPPGLMDVVFGDAERRDLEALAARLGRDLSPVGFSAKEAFYKCWRPLVGAFLDFGEVSLRLEAHDAGSGAFRVRVAGDGAGAAVAAAVQGRWRLADGLAFTGAAVTATALPDGAGP